MTAIRFRSGSRQASRGGKALSLTPLIDVVFILLLFFMLATNYQHWQAVPVNTAVLESSPSTDEAASVTIALRHQRYFWDNEPLDQPELLARLDARLRRQPSVTVIVAPAAQAPVQTLVSLLELLRSAGIVNLSLAVNQPDSP